MNPIYSTLVTARRREEIYPKHVKWLAYNSENELVAYLDGNGNETTIDFFEEEFEEMSAEKIVEGLNDLLKERNRLREEVEMYKNAPAKASTDHLNKLYRVTFSIRGDDPVETWGFVSKDSANAFIKRNQEKYGVDGIQNVFTQAYKVEFL